MRKTLENLYYGNITLNEQRMVPGSEMKKAVDRVTDCEKQLMEQPGETEQETLTKLIRSQHKINGITALENFILRFQLGVRLMTAGSSAQNCMGRGCPTRPCVASTPLLHAALDRAVSEKLLFRNPADGCRLPSAKAREMRVLTPEEIQRLLIQAK